MQNRSLLILSFICLLISSAFAQKQTNIWYFGQNAGLDFNSGAPVALTDGQLNTAEGCATICDASGNLLFYTDGIKVWNKNHLIMTNGNGLFGDPSSSQSGMIIPKPGSTTTYYIFTVDMQGGAPGAADSDGAYRGFRYSEVDMTASGGLGAVVVGQKNILLKTPTTEGVTAVQHANGTDIWVIAHGWNNNSYFSYPVTAAGVNTTPVQTNIGPVVTDPSIYGNGAIGCMKASPDGSKIAACHAYNNNQLVLSDFNNSTGVISNSLTISINSSASSDGPYGVEFSNCNEYLYVSEQFTVTGTYYSWPEKSTIWRFDLNAGSIPASQTNFATVNNEWIGALQLAADGYIYCGNVKRAYDAAFLEYYGVASGFLHRINNPRSAGATFTFNSKNLSGRKVVFGLPPFITSFFNKTDFSAISNISSDTIFCEGETALFTSQLGVHDSIRWYFGDPASGLNNTSTNPNPSHIYNTAGLYTTTLYKYLCNKKDSVKRVINVRAIPIFDIRDTANCNGIPITLDPGITGAIYNWSSGQTTQTAVYNAGGSFSLTVTKNQCSYSDNFSVAFTPLPAATITPSGPTTFCLPGSVTLSAPAAMESYQWLLNGSPIFPAQTSQTLVVSSSGNYSVKVGKSNCFNTSSNTTVTVSAAPTVSVTPVGPIDICSGNSTILTISTAGLSNIKWYKNSVLIPAQTTTTLSVNASGSYYATGDNSGCTGTSNTVVVNVTAVAPVSVSVLPSANPICSGTSVTYTASPTNGGASPSYQWYLNNNPVGSDSPTYTNASLANGNQVKVVLTSSSTCATGNPATSNTVTMTVNPNLPVSVSVAPSANPICTGTSVTFTATPTNGGSSPSYQWLLNGNPVGANSTTYTNATLANGDLVKVVLTSNASCATGSPATSNTVNMTVNPNLPASVSIVANQNPICTGTSVTFTATPVNGGTTPTYQWLLNGNPVGSNSATYTNSGFSNGDQVKVVLTSNAVCATGSPATSNTINMTVSAVAPVTVSIAASANPICTGTSVTFTATPNNGGTTPSYQWYLNGNPVGSNSATYTNSSLANGNQVKVVLTSNSTCATGNPATSNTVTMTVNPNLPVSVSVAASTNPICAGAVVTFTATPVNGGASPVYQWLLNGNPVGSNSPTYTNAALANGDQVSVRMTSNATCVSGSPATSNVVTMTVNALVSVSVSIAASANPVCPGSPVTFTATPLNGGTSPIYQWLLNGNPVGTNSPTYNNSSLTNGDNISVEMTVSTPCATGSPATSNVINMSVSNIVVDLGSDQSLCAGSQVTLSTGIAGADSYAWNTGENTPTIDVSSNGTYDVLVTKGSCADAGQVTISFDLLPPLPVNLGGDTLLCLGESILLDAGNQSGVAYLWQDGSSSATLLADRDGSYFVVLSNQCGSASDTAEVSTEDCSCRVYVPTAFSPNADGNNDLFIAIATCPVTQYRFSIFNRWSEMVFDTDQISVGWDGVFNGQPQPLDVYVYYLTYFNENAGEMITLKGYVNLLR